MTLTVRGLLLFVTAAIAPAQIQLEFAPQTATYNRALQLPNGDRLLVGSTPVLNSIGLFSCCPSGRRSQIALAALGTARFHNIPPALGGSGNDIPQAAVVDPNGNVWIVGNTDSDDFRLVNPVVAQKIPYRTAGFVIELDPTGNNVLFATYLGGKQSSTLRYATYATAIATDASGNVYVGGHTDEPDFPTTAGAYVAGHGGADSFFNTYFFSYLVKISPAGKLVYSALLGTGTSACIGGSRCVAQQSIYAQVSSVAVDGSGAAAVAGVNGGAYNYWGGYVSRLSADGSKLLWTAGVSIPYGVVTSIFMAPDANANDPAHATGNLNLFGQYATVNNTDPYFPPDLLPGGLFAAQMNADGSGLAYSADLGQSADASAAGMAVDALGNVYLAGASSSLQIHTASPGLPNLGTDFVLKLNRAGSPLQPPLRLPHGTITAPPALGGAGLLLVGSQGSLLTVPGSASDWGTGAPSIVGFANSASLAPNTGFAPGALLTLYGFSLPASARNLKVLVNGTPAPILYAGPNQINLQVPFEPPAFFVEQDVQVALPSGTIALQLPLGESLGLFTMDGSHAAALNQDGTVNSQTNPAPAGTIVALFGTGAIWPTGMQNGAVPTSAMPFNPDINKFEALSGDLTPLNIRYAGAAPGIIDGVFQINVELPAILSMPQSDYAIQLQSWASTGNSLSSPFSSNVVLVYIK